MEIRDQILKTLKGGNAFDTPQQLFDEIPVEGRFTVPEGMERSAWQIVEHMRLTLEDLTSYSSNWDGSYKEKPWPEGYWPKETAGDWDASVQKFFTAQQALEDLAAKGDLTAPFPWAKDHTLLREILLAVEHTAYHCGELVELARALRA
jgi:hypothetical protein